MTRLKITRNCETCGTSYSPHGTGTTRNPSRFCGGACYYVSITANPIDQFWSRVIIQEGCWGWTGATDDYGYGVFTAEQQRYSAHRFSYELHSEERLQLGECVLHHCDNPPCTNPKCLFKGTKADNVADMFAKGRNPRRGNFTDEQVLAIRADPRSYSKIMKDYGIRSSATVHRIKHKQRYIHV